LVLVSDGESTAGRLPPLLAAQLAAREGIRIYTIGVGRKGLVPIVENGQRKMEKMEVDEQTLRGIAILTGGAYFPATDTAALESIYRKIDELERTEVRTGKIWVPRPLYRWPLLAAMVLFLVLGFFPGLARRYRVSRAAASGAEEAVSLR
jgi:Ca-activated chloride channel family protein